MQLNCKRLDPVLNKTLKGLWHQRCFANWGIPVNSSLGNARPHKGYGICLCGKCAARTEMLLTRRLHPRLIESSCLSWVVHNTLCLYIRGCFCHLVFIDHNGGWCNSGRKCGRREEQSICFTFALLQFSWVQCAFLASVWTIVSSKWQDQKKIKQILT